MGTKIRTRLLLSAAALSATALVVSGCSSGGDAGAGDVESLNLWLPTPFGAESTSVESDAWDEILAPFEEEQSVDVDVTLIPWADYETKYLTGVSSDDGPDLGYMYGEMMGDYIVNGAIVPFDEYLDPAAVENMLYVDQGKVDGEQYALPFVVGGMRILWANMDLLSAAGVSEIPTTWDDFLSVSEKVTASGKTALLQSWGAPDRGMLNSSFFPLLWQAGGQILTDDGSKTAFNSEAGIAAANYLMTLLESGAMPSSVTGLTNDEVKSAFYGGETAFMFGTDGQLGEITDSGINADFIPSLEGEQRGTFVASDSLVLFDACPDKQLCTDLAEFILSGAQMTQFHENIVAYPPIGLDEEGDSENPFIPVYAENADILHSLPVAAGSAGVYNSLYTNLQQMLLGQKTPEQALEDAAGEGDSSLQAAQ
ncbi:ABC transporter substrate-binding protein [Agromyces italicus]|uniref:ABC transporter substrate-binding protein n=1 Tax=Agromyces italicus TaxID=279572 RepID=UPI0004113829|nr:sugar ABC transporter substrate-binding protein [Agromyces italicus]